jgi:hypothetical protein
MGVYSAALTITGTPALQPTGASIMNAHISTLEVGGLGVLAI